MIKRNGCCYYYFSRKICSPLGKKRKRFVLEGNEILVFFLSFHVRTWKLRRGAFVSCLKSTSKCILFFLKYHYTSLYLRNIFWNELKMAVFILSHFFHLILHFIYDFKWMWPPSAISKQITFKCAQVPDSLPGLYF